MRALCKASAIIRVVLCQESFATPQPPATNLPNDAPRSRFADLPAGVDELPRLQRMFGAGTPRLFVKRDDQTGLAFGGNKTRELEFPIAEAHPCWIRFTPGAPQPG